MWFSGSLTTAKLIVISEYGPLGRLSKSSTLRQKKTKKMGLRENRFFLYYFPESPAITRLHVTVNIKSYRNQKDVQRSWES